ncbi:MAG: hypothetical protein JST00_09885 [Deltaproteobacteria bacterium]|nr:hypothetical protein [Deltaproteobacteria bacterium]
MTELLLDAEKSRIRVQTFAEGLFARLAHDLELTCSELSGRATRESAPGEPTKGTATIEVPLRGLAIAGVLKSGVVDTGAMSPSDRRDALSKMQHDVFHVRADAVVRVEVHAEGASARVRIVPPNGKAVEVVTKPELALEGSAVRAKGKLELSLEAIGSDVVKGPMNAFRVKDRVAVLFDVVFA